MPSAAEVESFVLVMVETGSGFTARGLAQAVRPPATDVNRPPHGIVNLLAAVARALSGGDVRGALDAADPATLVPEVAALPEKAAHRVRGLLSRCGADPEPVPGTQLAGLGLL